MQRIVETNTGDNNYDVIYMSDVILPIQKPSNLHFISLIPHQNQTCNGFR